MSGILATPFWVNLLILIPVFLFFYWRNNRLNITLHTLLMISIFGIAFGFVEASVVVYLRAAIGFLPGYHGTIFQIWQQAGQFYSQPLAAAKIPESLLTVELFRETATMVMLATIAIASAKKHAERFALFIWVFSFWDLFYYIFLFLTVRWPQNLNTPDVLFLIPSPWIAQVWFPISVSLLSILAVFISRKSRVLDN